MYHEKGHTQAEICEQVGVSYNTLADHTMRGAIPEPSICFNRRKYYTGEQKDMIVAHFKSRDKGSPIGFYQRIDS